MRFARSGASDEFQKCKSTFGVDALTSRTADADDDPRSEDFRQRADEIEARMRRRHVSGRPQAGSLQQCCQEGGCARRQAMNLHLEIRPDNQRIFRP